MSLVLCIVMLSLIWVNVMGAEAGLSKVQLTSPNNRTEDQPTRLTLRWEPVDGADFYRVFVSRCFLVLDDLSKTDTSCGNCILTTTTSSNYYEIPKYKLMPETWYVWMVRAEIRTGEKGSNSYIRGFTTGKEPDLIIESKHVNPKTMGGSGAKSVSVTCCIGNQGSGKAYLSQLKYYFSNNNAYDSNDLLLGTDHIGYISSGGYRGFNIKFVRQ